MTQTPAPSAPLSLFENLEVARQGKKTVVRPKREPSRYQQAILEAVQRKDYNLKVNATAGSGKTTLLEMIAQTLSVAPGEKAAFLAYNLHIVKELKKVIPPVYDIRTVNSLGHLICTSNLPGVKFEPHKYRDLTREVIKAAEIPSPAARKELEERLETTLQLHVGHALPLKITQEEWSEIMYNLDAPIGGSERTLWILTRRILKEGLVMLRDQQVLSFLDQSYAPYFFGWTLPEPYRYILVDEVQDLSKAQLAILQAATGPDTLIVGVGDENQSIYGFSGADSESMKNFSEVFNALELPLSITYRCPRRHVELARHYTTQIEAAPGAPEGTLEDISTEEFRAQVSPGDLVLCRTTAPLVEHFYGLVSQGTPAVVRGRDLCRSLVAFARDVATWDIQRKRSERKTLSDSLSMAEFMDKLTDYTATQQEKITEQAQREETSPDARLNVLMDKFGALSLVLEQEEVATLGEYIQNIRRLFEGKPEDSVVLSTVHRAKGLETDNVYIIRPDLLPFPRAKSEKELQSERCLEFVAYTRARKALYFVDAEESKIPAGLAGYQDE